MANPETFAAITGNPPNPGVSGHRTRSWIALVFSCLLCVLGGAASGLVAPPGAWYQSLLKPNWTPPPWLFGPVWTILYIMIGVAGWMIWSSRKSPRGRAAFGLFALQLVLNFAWTPVFFGLHAPGPAFGVISALVACIAGTIVVTWRTERAASLLLIPYAAWVCFASALNFALWRMN
jgi:tryptophan-rich sensory protein